MKIGYFINQYPAVSHTFIRREIGALEALGVEISRYSIRPQTDGLTDDEDKRELQRTSYIINAGGHIILGCLFRALFTQPLAALKALKLAIKVGSKSDRGLVRHLVYVVEAIVLASWCRRDGIEHIHAHFGTNSAAIAMLAQIFSGISYSFTAHGPEEFDKGKWLSLDEKVRRAAFAVCVSYFGCSQLMRWVPSGQWDKIQLVHCGLDEQFLNDVVPPPVEAARLVCVGRLCVEKAQPILVKAVEKLHQEGVSCEIVLVGDGPLRTDVEAAVKKAGLQRSISITGWASGKRVKQEIAKARALVLPSFAENLPVVIMEAMALGRPVVSTYVAGIPELVRPGENGWLVPPSDVDALAATLREILNAPAEDIARMGTEARKRVKKQHDVKKEAAKLKKHFANVLAT